MADEPNGFEVRAPGGFMAILRGRHALIAFLVLITAGAWGFTLYAQNGSKATLPGALQVRIEQSRAEHEALLLGMKEATEAVTDLAFIVSECLRHPQERRAERCPRIAPSEKLRSRIIFERGGMP